ncbi:MAG: cation diffusion facilitator family transporter [Persicimonas sp.]
MGHAHSHDHGHGHSHRARDRKRLMWTLILVVGYMGAEVVGGLLSNSLALLADAGHMFSDAASLALSLFAMWIAARPPTAERTYGYYRAEILAALFNGTALAVVALYVYWEAYHRFTEPAEVTGPLMMGVAIGGLTINLIGLWLLHAGKSESLNVRGAWLHVVGDTLGSVGAIGAAVFIWAFGWNWADPLASVIIATLILFSAVNLVREAVAVLMEGAPGHIDVDEVRHAMRGVEGVHAVHDLHVWTITSGLVALSAHVDVDDLQSYTQKLDALRHMLDERFGIAHVTVQLEPAEYEHERGRI